MQLLFLFFTFFKIGLFSIGGGLATLPFLYELAAKSDWLSLANISNLVAISESTPGPLGINMATYVGYIQEGVLGALITPLGEITPSVIIILILAGCLKKYRNSAVFEHIFYGLRPASVAMITVAGISIVKMAFFDETFSKFFWQGGILAVILYIALRKFKLHPIWYIAFSAAVGIIFKFSV